MTIRKALFTIAVTAAITAASTASAQQRLLASEELHGFGFGYGDTRYDNFSAQIDLWFDSVDIAPNLEDLSQMLQYDAIMVQLRGFNATLTPTEKTNLAEFIATGRHVLMIGENPSLWFSWNQDLCTVAGGSSTNQESNGEYDVANTHPILTNGVSRVHIPNGGIANGGTNIFTVNTATLWDGNGNQNVVTMLDVNVFEDDRWDTLDGAAFSSNVAEWLGSGPGAGGTLFAVSGSCPGRITVQWSGATPGRPMGIILANSLGSFTVPGGPCGGTQLGLSGSGIQLVYTGNTGANGNGQLNSSVGTGACRKYLQMAVVDGNPCDTSNVAQIP